MKKATFLFPEVLMTVEFVTEFTYDVFKTQNKKDLLTFKKNTK